MTAFRIRLIVVLLIATLVFVGIVYAVDVPVENPSFTYSLSGWSIQVNGCTVEWTADGISIPGAALFTCVNEDNSGLLVQTIPISSSGIYTFSIVTLGDISGFIYIGYDEGGGSDDALAFCPSTEISECSISLDVPDGISSVYLMIGMTLIGTRKFDDADLSYEPSFIEPTPVPTSLPTSKSPTAFGFMLGNTIYMSIGLLTFFSMLAVGMWISRIKIVGGIKQRDDD